MFDLVRLQLQAGDGGHGRISFHREKSMPKGGPDGGTGGNGGSIYIKGSKHFNTLQHYAGVKEYSAPAGKPGGKEKCAGGNGEDLVLEVPIGTTVWLLAENPTGRSRRLHQLREGDSQPTHRHKKCVMPAMKGSPPPAPKDHLLVVNPDEVVAEAEIEDQDSEDPGVESAVLRSESLKNIRIKDIPKIRLLEIMDEEPILLCQGGFGGRGNEAFKGSTNVTPLESEFGTFGEKKIVLFELKLLADVGLIGYPNAGKSTLLSLVTRANPKIANYPFTTIEPNLGVMSIENENGTAEDVVIADIPGLIEGASQGKGLGYDFLRHIQACKALLFVLSLDEVQIFDQNLDDRAKAELLYQQCVVLKKELADFDQELLKKEMLFSVSKADLYSKKLAQAIEEVFATKEMKIHIFSAITKKGIDQLKDSIQKVLR